MLQEDPDKRWTVEKIINCRWMVNHDVPNQEEVSFEGLRIIEVLREKLDRLTVTEPIDIL
jgi:predicted metallopeptidase